MEISNSARDTYLGWTELAHLDGCKKPIWEIDTRVDYDVWRDRSRGSDIDHRCVDEECDAHGKRYTRTTVRMVCRSCGTARLLAGDARLTPTTTAYLGYGQQPRRMGQLLLWPGPPFSDLAFSVPGEREPYELLVTGPGVRRPRREDLLGHITQVWTPRHALRYSANAGLSPDGEYGWGEFRWSAAAERLKTVSAAARWIAAQTITRTATAEGGDRS